MKLLHAPETGCVLPREPGQWRHWVHGSNRLLTVALLCPRCSRPFCLAKHTIDAAGAASPSVVCPHEGCSFHEFVTLEGWP